MKEISKEKLEENLEKRISDDVSSGRVGGASVIVVQNGQTVYKNCFGYKNIKEKDRMTEDAIFRMASMTKPITAVAVLQLIEKGKLTLDTPVSRFFPGFAHMKIARLGKDGGLEITGEAENQITIEDLLSHKSGLACMDAGYKQTEKMTAEDKKSLKTAVCFYQNMALDFEPGEMERYSPVAGFDVLAETVEVISDMPFAEYVRKNISVPMGMADTTLTPNDEQRSRIVSMHDYKDERAADVFMECIFADFPATYTCGGAGAVSSINDYSKFAQMLLGGGVFEGRRIVSENMIKKMQIPRPPYGNVPPWEMWGLGVRVNKNGFYPRLPEGAFGWSGAYGTHFWVDIENKITAVYMKNSLYDGGSGALTAAHFEEDVYSAVK